MTNNDKGYLYELQIRDYIINELRKPAYLWNDTPETILLDNNISSPHLKTHQSQDFVQMIQMILFSWSPA